MSRCIKYFVLVLTAIVGGTVTVVAQYVPITQSTSVNITSTTAIQKSGVAENATLTSLNAEEVSQAISYADGLGRTFQSIGVGQSPQGGDIIMPGAHTKNGFVDSAFLAYAVSTATGAVRTNALRGTPTNPATYTTSEQYLFYQGTSKVSVDEYPFSRAAYRNTPDAKVIEQGAPGVDWQLGSGNTVRHTMDFNNSTTYRVRYWKPDGTTNSDYPNNTVVVSITTDENDNIVRTYTNSLGQTVLKQVQVEGSTYLETYFVYDEFGRIKYQLPPKAMSVLGSGSSLDANNSTIAELIYKYTYDPRSRLIVKKVPGAAEEYVVYDKLDRMALTQDGNLRPQNKWLFIKYDRFNRPVYNGVTVDASTRTTLQTYFDNLDLSVVSYFESEQDNASFHGYTNTVFPTANTTLLGVNYYDHYNFNRQGDAIDYPYDNTHFGGQEQSASSSTRGLVTGSKNAIVDDTGNVTCTWLVNVVFYDKYGRPIQTLSNNHLYATLADKTTLIYDFVKVLKSKSTHYSSSTESVTTTTRNVYDHEGRLNRIYHTINGSAERVVAAYVYNALGQVVEKNLHCTSCREDYDPTIGQTGTVHANIIERDDTHDPNELRLVAKTRVSLLPGYYAASGTTMVARLGLNKTDYDAQFAVGGNFLQSVDYRYNIRGWLTSINNSQLAVVTATNDDTNDHFGMEIAYNTAAGISNTPYYNGNISALKWKGPGTAGGTLNQRSYKYTYDKSDRLTTATFQAHGNSGWTKEVNTLDEIISYDPNGNISTLQRKSDLRGLSTSGASPVVTSTPQNMDNLTYTYATGNQLTNVEDSGLASGFSDVDGSTTEYTYDYNGSLNKDVNKGIDEITYNILGKPLKVEFISGPEVKYFYSGDGTKLKMTVTEGSNTTVTDYVGGFVYQNAVLSFFSSPEGRIVKNGSTFEYQYSISDHQGNTRALFTSATAPVQSVTATFEPSVQGDEAAKFENYPSISGINPVSSNNHTPGGTSSQYLHGGLNAQVGVAKSFDVFPGDEVKIEAYARYTEGSGSGNLGSFATALLAAFDLPAPGGGESGTPSSAVNTWGTIEAGGYAHGVTNSAPKAFVNIILFDKNYNLIDATYSQVTSTGSPGYISASYTVREEGYAYVYISNENATIVDVYFDDVTMSYTPGPVIQYNEYYPFGLQTAYSWTRDGNTGNNFLGNGGTELNATTGVYDLAFRNYDPALGRMNGVDPVAGKYVSITPYNYSFNNPVSINDPSGADPYGSECELCDPIYEQYTGMIYMSSFDQWVQDDKIMYRFVGWGPPVARYRGTLALPENFYRGGSPFASMDKYWKPGDGRLYWGMSEEYARELRWAADAVRYGDMTSEQYGDAYGQATTVDALMLSMIRDIGMVEYAYYQDARARQMQAAEGPLYALADGSTDPSECPPGVPCDKKKLQVQAGIGSEDLVGPALIGVGAKFKALKPVGALGSQPGSSVASSTLSKVLPVKMPFRVAGTTNLGRMLGRTLPFTSVGVVMTAFTIEDIFRDISPTFDMIIGMRDFKMGIRRSNSETTAK